MVPCPHPCANSRGNHERRMAAMVSLVSARSPKRAVTELYPSCAGYLGHPFSNQSCAAANLSRLSSCLHEEGLLLRRSRQASPSPMRMHAPLSATRQKDDVSSSSAEGRKARGTKTRNNIDAAATYRQVSLTHPWYIHSLQLMLLFGSHGVSHPTRE
jgi:hypothetical protein